MRGSVIKIIAVLFIAIIAAYGLSLYQSGTLQAGFESFKSNLRKQSIPEPPPPPSIEPSALELRIHTLVNGQRLANGLSEVEWNSEVAAVARLHSQYLASLPSNSGFVDDIFIAHEGADGGTHSDRLNANSIYYFAASAENIHAISIIKTYYNETRTPASYYTQEEIALSAVEGWMRSAGHRRNILTGSFDEAGTGVATDATGTNYVTTQVFIERAECGFRGGPCCEKPGYYPFCYVPLECTGGVCG